MIIQVRQIGINGQTGFKWIAILEPGFFKFSGMKITKKQAIQLIQQFSLVPESRREGLKTITDYNRKK